nr:MAG TPA: hypothetical protein [Ackermannviridae sp.]DAW82315.1 MAG TPA: hypothetical protein [Bacteriophage sp.]
MKTNKLNWLNIGKGYESIRLILNKKKVEAMGFNKLDNNEVLIEYDIENKVITIRPTKSVDTSVVNMSTIILSMKGEFSLEDVLVKVSKINTNLANKEEIQNRLNALLELGMLEINSKGYKIIK